MPVPVPASLDKSSAGGTRTDAIAVQVKCTAVGRGAVHGAVLLALDALVGPVPLVSLTVPVNVWL